MLQGDLKGVKQSWVEALKELEDLATPAEEFMPEEATLRICEISGGMNREISLFLNRGGRVLAVSVGGLDRVELPELRENRSERFVSGVRCLHTHPGGDPTLSAVDLQSLRALRMDAMAAIGVGEGGRPTGLCAAFLDAQDGELAVREYGPYPFRRVPQGELMERIAAAEAAVRALPVFEAVTAERERAVLFGIDHGDSEDSLRELERLADTAGADTVHVELQRRAKPENATYLGRGKLAELALIVQAEEADLAICDDELTGVQIKNLEELLGVRVIDRTALILDIFAARARSREGKLQVELAQMRYRLPRLLGLGSVLSRQGGGIGTRGPGETQLEVDRRRIRRRIYELTEQIEAVKRQRDQRRTRVRKGELPVVALVGYTNAGKSTLLNRLSGAEAYVADQLFATLDPVMRRAQLDEDTEVLLVDTVGFVNKLPHDLVEAFRSTLEEAVYADLLVHVADGASPEREMQMRVVRGVLEELGAEAPQILAVNKSDLAQAGEEGGIPISAVTGAGIEELKAEIRRRVAQETREGEWLIPYDRGAVLARLHDAGKVLEQSYEEDGVRVRAVLPLADYERLKASLEGADA